MHVTAADWLISDAMEAWSEDPSSNSFVIDVAPLNGSQWAQLISFFSFSHLAVRLAQSRSPGAMTL